MSDRKWTGQDVFWGFVIGILLTFAFCAVTIVINHGR
jgi:hypothetical protein